MRRGTLRQYVITGISQLSVLLVGAAYCWFEPITLRLTQDSQLNMTSEDVSWLISIIELGSLASPVLAGYMSDRLGRKMVLLSIGPLCLIGWLIVPLSMSVLWLSVARVLQGLATGVAYTVQPIYTAEIAEPKLRGRLSGAFQTAFYVGTLFVFSIGPYMSYENYAYACVPIPFIFTAIFLYCPETPYYLLMKGKEEEARIVLRYFRDTSDIEDELAKMKVSVKEEMSETNSWRTLFFDKNERKAFIIVQIVCVAKFMTGMAVIVNYAVETFSRSESFLPPGEMSIILGVLLTAIAVLSAFLSDWIGRKPLLLVSCFGCFAAHLLTGLYYYFHEKTSIDTKPYVWMLYLGLTLYCFFSDIGLGPLLQTLQSEMFGASTRGLAGGITEALAAFYCFITLKAYTPVNESIGVYMNFWFYSAMGLINGLLLVWLMYETAGKTIGQMEKTKEKKVHSEEGVRLGNFTSE
ncbi:facilitated trehalose transporter Tret1 [Halyomorpha halys]|uniref:facilitated trehalose transporter Tret1 n=1 Tax=Halyomorpha halys TaxID=286706 RepID=UPI0006D5124C|nr:facilitated trehalose transporter Tret1-like [Halyomorpha halys]